MIVRPMRQLVPPYLLAGKWIVVLVCYLDDSGKDSQNPITTLAGYIARDTDWAAYEAEVEHWFTEYGVNILHAKELHDTDGDFKGWPKLKKQSFVSRICLARSPYLLMGMSMAAAKAPYELHKSERRPQHTVSPYGFCFNRIIDWIFRDIRIGSLSNTEGVALILECGHENNVEAEREFYAIKKRHPDIDDLLKSISFVSKGSCRAIQLADLLAFYSRRESVAQFEAYENQRDNYEADIMIKIITENLPHRAFVATEFGPNAGSRYLERDL